MTPAQTMNKAAELLQSSRIVIIDQHTKIQTLQKQLKAQKPNGSLIEMWLGFMVGVVATLVVGTFL